MLLLEAYKKRHWTNYILESKNKAGMSSIKQFCRPSENLCFYSLLIGMVEIVKDINALLQTHFKMTHLRTSFSSFKKSFPRMERHSSLFKRNDRYGG